MRFSSIGLAALLAGCASAPPPEPPTPKPEVPAATVVWSVPVSWESGYPLITADIRDGGTKMAIATSASNHTLTKTFATSVRAPVSTTRQTTKVGGAATDVEKIEGVVAIKAADAEWRLEQVVATESPKLDAMGIGGLLAPQALVTNDTTVVMDFRGGAFTLVQGDHDVFLAWFTEKYGAPADVELQRQNGLLYADATVAPIGPQRVRLSTDSRISQFPAAAFGMQVGADTCLEDADLTQECTAGEAASVESVTTGPVSFAGKTVGAVASGEPVMGADLLKGCVVALTFGSKAHFACK